MDNFVQMICQIFFCYCPLFIFPLKVFLYMNYLPPLLSISIRFLMRTDCVEGFCSSSFGATISNEIFYQVLLSVTFPLLFRPYCFKLIIVFNFEVHYVS